MQQTDRRDFLKLAGMAGVTFTAGLFAGRQAAAQAATSTSCSSPTPTGAIAARQTPTPSTR